MLSNAEILELAPAASTDWQVMGWTSRSGVSVSIFFVPGAEPLFQLRQSQGPASVEVLPFPATEAGLTEVRAIARLRAELLKSDEI
jgi:hypothetical protein